MIKTKLFYAIVLIITSAMLSACDGNEIANNSTTAEDLMPTDVIDNSSDIDNGANINDSEVPDSDSVSALIDVENINAQETGDSNQGDVEDSNNGTEYTFLDGRMSVVMSEKEYDVFVLDTDPNSPALAHQNYSKEKIDLYMSLCGYELEAVPVGDSLADYSIRFSFNIKEPKYTGVKNLQNLSKEEKDLVASTVTSSFAGVKNGYDWFKTDDADWFVFSCDMVIDKNIRYATIMDERMIYIIAQKKDDYPNEEEAAMLKSIVQNIRWH